MALRIPISSNDHVQGNSDGNIEIVEYGDYECPYCGEAYYEVKKIKDKLGDKLKFVFRNFPLTNIHPYALKAAIATEVAGDMGKFWEMHDIIFENQDALSDASLLEYAKEIGLDVEKFEEKFSDKKYQSKIEEDIEGGLRSGVNGTPSFFINGEKYNGSYYADNMLEYINSL